MASAKKRTTKKPIADVARPGKSAPATNSKSVIITNRPVIKDPMMAPEAPKVPEVEPEAPMAAAKHNTLSLPATAPLVPDAALVSHEVAPSTKAPKISEMIARANKPVPKPAVPKPVPATKRKLVAKPQSELVQDDKPEQVVAAGAVTNPVDDAALLAEHQAHEAAIQELVTSKKYFLPINAVEKRRTERIIFLGVVFSLFLLFAWVDIALDAHLITLGGLKPLTHFFSS